MYRRLRHLSYNILQDIDIIITRLLEPIQRIEKYYSGCILSKVIKVTNYI